VDINLLLGWHWFFVVLPLRIPQPPRHRKAIRNASGPNGSGARTRSAPDQLVTASVRVSTIPCSVDKPVDVPGKKLDFARQRKRCALIDIK
jgi:hypothetical protein